MYQRMLLLLSHVLLPFGTAALTMQPAAKPMRCAVTMGLSATTLVADIEKLKSLNSDGVLSDEEFSQAKAALIIEAGRAQQPGINFQPPETITELPPIIDGEIFYTMLFKHDDHSRARCAEIFEAAKDEPEALEELVNYKSPWGHTMLMQACAYNHLDVVKGLIEAGADVNAASSDGELVLNWALIGGEQSKPEDWPEEQIIKVLVNHGAQLGPGKGNHPERLEPYL